VAAEPVTGDPTSEQAQTASMPDPEVEYGSFTKAQLYQAIISELGAQRGVLEDAGDSYFNLALETKDLGIIRRAVQFASANNDLNALLQKKDTQALPKQVLEAVQELKQTLVTYQSDGQIGGPAQESIESLQRSLNELQPLLRELRKDPNVLIFDKKTQPDIQPRAGTQ